MVAVVITAIFILGLALASSRSALIMLNEEYIVRNPLKKL
jgi:hypothetical protein